MYTIYCAVPSVCAVSSAHIRLWYVMYTLALALDGRLSLAVGWLHKWIFTHSGKSWCAPTHSTLWLHTRPTDRRSRKKPTKAAPSQTKRAHTQTRAEKCNEKRKLIENMQPQRGRIKGTAQRSRANTDAWITKHNDNNHSRTRKEEQKGTSETTLNSAVWLETMAYECISIWFVVSERTGYGREMENQ